MKAKLKHKQEMIGQLYRYQFVIEWIREALESGNPFTWSEGQRRWFTPLAVDMGVTLVTQAQAKEKGYRLKRGAQPVGRAYFRRVNSHLGLYVLECQCVPISD